MEDPDQSLRVWSLPGSLDGTAEFFNIQKQNLTWRRQEKNADFSSAQFISYSISVCCEKSNTYSKQKKGLKLSNRQGMRKVRSKLSASFSSFSSVAHPCALDNPSTHSTGTKPDPTPQDTTQNSSSLSPRASALDSATGTSPQPGQTYS